MVGEKNRVESQRKLKLPMLKDVDTVNLKRSEMSIGW